MPEPPIPKGKLGAVYEALADEDRKPYLEALYDRSITAERLSWVLAQMNHRVSPSLIRTVRREAERDGAVLPVPGSE